MDINNLNEIELCKLLKTYVENSTKLSEKVIRGNKTAGRDVRKDMQYIRNISFLIRDKIQKRGGKKGKDICKTQEKIKIENSKFLELKFSEKDLITPNEDIIYMDFLVNSEDALYKLNSILQHKLRVLMKCAIIFNFTFTENSNITFQKKHRIKKQTFEDPKIYGAYIEIYKTDNQERVLIRIILTKY